MKAHLLLHVPFEGPGTIKPWLQAEAWTISCTRFYEPYLLPDHTDIDFLIVMGGPMSVNNEESYPWLKTEKKFIRAVIEHGIPVLGICLGAQLIASAFGKKVYQNETREIGWLPVSPVATGNSDLFRFPSQATVFHWHGETFDLPEGAALLASSEGCTNQAFQLGTTVIGLQFHLEITKQTVREMLINCHDDLTAGRYVQTEDDILSGSIAHSSSNNGIMNDILTYLTNPEGDSI